MGPTLRAVAIAAVGLTVILLLTIVYTPELRSPHIGLLHDDGVYLVTARALAEGQGYIVNSLPQPIAQTKYPVLLPALIAATWTAAPNFPDNVILVRLIPWAFLWIWMAILWRLVAHELRRPETAAWIVMLTLASADILRLGTEVMTDVPFAALSTWVLLLLVRAHRAGLVSLRYAAALGIAAALPFHVRTLGVTLLPAALVVFWRLRAPAQALVFLTAWFCAAGPWLIWQAVHSGPVDPFLAYYTGSNYFSWNALTGDAGVMARVVGKNIAYMLSFPGSYYAVIPHGFVSLVVSVLLVLAAAIGSSRALRTELAAPAVWFLSTACVLGLWMWPPLRFLAPLIPILLLLSSLPIRNLRSPVIRHAARGAGAALVVASFLSQVLRAREHERTPLWVAETAAAAEWIRTRTSADAIVAANLDTFFFLHGHRRAIRSFLNDPYHLFYAPSAPAGGFGSSNDLHGLLTRYDVTHLVMDDFGDPRDVAPYRERLQDFKEEWPGALTAAWRSSSGGITIYTVVRDAL